MEWRRVMTSLLSSGAYHVLGGRLAVASDTSIADTDFEVSSGQSYKPLSYSCI